MPLAVRLLGAIGSHLNLTRSSMIITPICPKCFTPGSHVMYIGPSSTSSGLSANNRVLYLQLKPTLVHSHSFQSISTVSLLPSNADLPSRWHFDLRSNVSLWREGRLSAPTSFRNLATKRYEQYTRYRISCMHACPISDFPVLLGTCCGVARKIAPTMLSG